MAPCGIVMGQLVRGVIKYLPVRHETPNWTAESVTLGSEWVCGCGRVKWTTVLVAPHVSLVERLFAGKPPAAQPKWVVNDADALAAECQRRGQRRDLPWPAPMEEPDTF